MRDVGRREWARMVCLVLAWSLALEGPGFHALAAAPQTSAAREELATRFASQLRASLQALEDGDREAPRDRWDPAYVVDTVGLEPAALLGWVRGAVRWVPYRGALRGATGVLMDRVGNGLDQALLVAELLRAAGKTPRLAHADLSSATANETWRRVVRPAKAPFVPAPPPPPASAAAAAAAPTDVLESADLYGIDRASVASIVGTARKDAEDMARDLRVRVDDQLARLSSAVGLPIVTPSAGGGTPEQLAALADHWWAEYRDGGKWVAVDPLADGGPGATLAPATRTAEPDALPTELEQLVTVRVVTEQTKGNVRKESVPVEHTLAARGVIGERIVVQHFPMAWPRDWPQVSPDDVQIKLRAAFLTQDQWMPIVRVGERGYNRAAVRDTGEIDESPAPANPFQTMMVPATGQIAKATDVLATLGAEEGAAPPAKEKAPDKEARAEGELTAEWLELELAAPGAAPRKLRREIFDLIGPAARAAAAATTPLVMTEARTIARSMALLGEAEIQVLPCRLSPDFTMHLAARNAGANRELLDEMASDPFSKLPPNYLETFGKLTPLPAALLGYALARFEGNPYAAAVYVDRPAVTIQHTTMSRGKGGDFFASAALDIVENGVGVDPRVAVAVSTARMAQGIADTNAEIAAMRRLGEPAINTSEAFAADAKAGRAWTALKPGDDARVAKLGLPADVAQRIALDLKAGFAVVAPGGGGEAAANAGWWRVDPTTGATLGVGPTGHGQALVEYALVIVIQTIIATAQCMIANAASKALVRALKDRSARAPIEAAKEGYKEGKESWAKADGYKCVANGMLSGLDLMVMMWTMKPFSMFGPGEAEVKRPEVPLYEGEGPGKRYPEDSWKPPPGERPPEKPPTPGGEKPPQRGPEPQANEPRGKEPLDLKPKPERKTPEDLDKARKDREQKQKKLDEAREKLERAEDDMAREHGNPPKNLDDVQRRNAADEALEKAQKEYDESRRQERYSREREYLAQTEKEAYESAKRKDAADAAMQDHVNKGGSPEGKVYDEWKQANEADKKARSDWMNARFGQLPGDKPASSAGGGSAPAPGAPPSPGAGSVPPPAGSPMAGSVGPAPGAASVPAPGGSPMAGSIGPGSAPGAALPPPTSGQTAPGIGIPGVNKGAQSGSTIPGVQVPDVVRHIPPDQSPVGMNPYGGTVPAAKSPFEVPPPEPPPAAMAGAAGLSSTMKLLTAPPP